MKRFGSILIIVLAVVTAITVPLSFVYGSVLQAGLAQVLRIRVNTVFAGGEELARFRDPVGDDRGAGSLEYPLNPAFDSVHSLDVVRYTVFRPQVGASWSNPRDFWQLSLVFADLPPDDGAAGFAGPVVSIYIGLGEPGGSVETADSRSELVRFDPEHPWNLVVTIDSSHKRARLRSADGQLDRQITLMVNSQKKSLTVRLPLDNPRISKVLDGRSTWHYVLVGAHDPLASGGFMAVKETAGLSAGGGALSRQTPRVFDCLVPKGSKQALLLAGFDELNGELAMVYPVQAPAFDPAGSGRNGPWAASTGNAGSNMANRERLIAELESQVAKEQESADQSATNPPADDSEMGKAIAMFQSGQTDAAMAALTSILVREPENAKALAYQGALVAQAAGRSDSVAESVRLVNLAYESMDRAVSLAGEKDRPDVWIVRGSVSLAVPESVFGKNRQASSDFAAAAEWAARQGDSVPGLIRLRSECSFKAGLAMEQAGAPDEAEIWFLRAAAVQPTPAWVRLELAKRDLLEE